MAGSSEVVLRAEGICKSYAVPVLRDVNFELLSDEIHGLVGENGAGKSTFIKIVSGAISADSGTIWLNGEPLRASGPRQVLEAGIGTVYQDAQIVPQLTGAENMLLGRYPTRRGRVLSSAMQKTCEKVVAGLQIHLDLGVPAGQLSVAEQQLLQIARAASFRSLRVLILDEPTSALTPSEVGRLFALLRQMRASGVATIFITHRLNEVLELADRVTVLRDGATVGTWPSAATSEELLVRHMVGRATDPVVRLAPSSLSANGMLEVQSLCGDGFEDVSFTVHAGEVLVVFGLVGSGRSEVLRGVFGVEVVRSGRVMVDGHELRKHSVADSVQAGLGMVPEDRKRQGLVGSMSVRENVSLASLRRITKLGFIEKREDRQLAAGFQRELNIQPSDVQTKVTSLSGGNQQKVVIARWLATSPKVLMLDDPTAGVDVGAKAEVHRLIRSIAQGGAAVLLVSSDVREVLSVADRVLVMHEGRVMGIVDLDSATEEKLVALASGVPLAEAG